ncbi:MAG: ABC transporter ATP-binding protein [Actinobacteria bacterium]|nr:ABC transporter ATP-binding protein [Actinomycetota bacterium]
MANAEAPATAPSRAVLELTGVSKHYSGSPPVRALDDVTLSVDAGELVAIVGASGSGKSTLLNIIGTLDRPTEGQIAIEQTAVATLSDAGLAGLRSRRIGFVFQQFHLLEAATALDNVATGLIYQGIRRGRRRAMAKEALDRVGLGHRLDHKPPKLSGGERQRVAIARAIVGDPAIVLADEPTGNLDSRTSADIVDLLIRLNRDGSTIIIITHDQELAASLPRRVTLNDGRVVGDDTHGAHLPYQTPEPTGAAL